MSQVKHAGRLDGLRDFGFDVLGGFLALEEAKTEREIAKRLSDARVEQDAAKYDNPVPQQTQASPYDPRTAVAGMQGNNLLLAGAALLGLGGLAFLVMR